MHMTATIIQVLIVALFADFVLMAVGSKVTILGWIFDKLGL